MSGIRLVATLLLVLVSGCSPAPTYPPSAPPQTLTEDDERRLDLDLLEATTTAQISEAVAIGLANDQIGFAITPEIEIAAFLADPVRHDPAMGEIALPTSWVVRYSGLISVGAPHPVPAPGGPAQPEQEGPSYAYVLVNAVTGQILEITYTGA